MFLNRHRRLQVGVVWLAEKEVACVNHRCQLVIEELQRRNFAATTTRTYVKGVENFSLYFHRRPDQLGPAHIRRCQGLLFGKRKFSPNTVGPAADLIALLLHQCAEAERNWSIAIVGF